jgi:HPt (histidine-containing phosphotransfer) domain-containing protein
VSEDAAPSGPSPIRVVAAPAELRRRALVVEGSLEEGLREAVARAERALDELRPAFVAMLADDVARLAEAARAFAAEPTREARRALFQAAHDLRGQAGLLGHPLIGRIAASLARLVERGAEPGPLVARHVEAIGAMLREGARDESDPIGAALATELERLGEAGAKRAPARHPGAGEAGARNP